MSAPAVAAAPDAAIAMTDRLPDLEPFNIDPVLFKPLMKAGMRARWVSIGAPLLIIGIVAWSAAAADLLVWPVSAGRVWSDILLFVTHRPSTAPPTMPLLRDYPSLVLAGTVSSAVMLVYSLYRHAARLHRDLEKSGCVTYDDADRAELNKRIADVNDKLRRRGLLSPVALVLSFVVMLIVNLSMRTRLFNFLGPDLYQNWWASLTPLRPGGVVWVFFGGIGIYMVYIEAVLGLTYVNFLRRLHQEGKYTFNANPINPDGFFGWRRLRHIVTNLQAGVVTTLLSAWTFSFFLQPAVGDIATVIVLFIFIGIVLFVYFSVNSGFSRQVIQSKRRQALEVGERIKLHTDAVAASFHGPQPTANGPTNSERMLYLLVAYRHLEHINQIPSTPIRQRWLVAGVLSLLGTLSAIIIPILQYLQ
jgi:hypothetical protein